MQNDAFAGCKKLRRVEVAEGCEIAVERYLPSTAYVVTVPTCSVLGHAESDSDSDQNVTENTMTLRVTGERDDEVQKLREQLEIVSQ